MVVHGSLIPVHNMEVTHLIAGKQVKAIHTIKVQIQQKIEAIHTI